MNCKILTQVIGLYCDITAEKAGIVQCEEEATAKQRLRTHVYLATYTHTIEELLEEVFSMPSVPMLYKETTRRVRVSHSEWPVKIHL
jgi:hypothetical protein